MILRMKYLQPEEPKAARGSSLVAVFWLMSILGLAVFTSVRLLYYELDLVTAQVHGAKARQMAERGIAVAANPVVERTDPLLHQEFEGGQYGFSVDMRSEGARFNINAILLALQPDGSKGDKALLRSIFNDWGVEIEVIDEIVDALVDWVDEDDGEEFNGAERETYEEMGYFNRPYNQPFYSLDEMRLVRGMEIIESVYPNWQSWFTIWSSGGLDVNDAPAEFVAKALNTTVAEAETFTNQVLGPDGIRGNEDDQPFNNSAEVMNLLGVADPQVEARITANEQTTRLEATGWSGEVRRRVTLIVRNRTGQPTILERKEEVVP